jgi:hypothetical protein
MEKGFLCDGNRDDDVAVPEHARNSPSSRKPYRYGESTANDAHDDESLRFSKGVAAPYFEMIDAMMVREYGERKADKGRRRYEVRTLYSSPNTSPATLIDGARHPDWVLNSRHMERQVIYAANCYC